MRYSWRNERTYHLLPGRADGRTLCGLVVLPERGDQSGDEPPEDHRLCYRCSKRKND